MTEQLERDLTDLFTAAATRLDIRPPGPRAVRFTRLNVALAAALTLALVGGVAVAGVRLATPGPGDRGVVSAGGDAKSVLLAALRRTFSRPVRILTTMRVPGSPDASTETDIDYAHHEAVERVNGAVQMLSVNDEVYQRISAGMAEMFAVPAGVEWQQLALPSGIDPVLPTAASGSWSSLFGVDPSNLDDPAATARFTVERLTQSQYAVTSPTSDPQSQNATFTVSGDVVTGASVNVTINPPAGLTTAQPRPRPLHLSAQITLQPLSEPLAVTPPAPRTVLTQAQFQRLAERRHLNNVQTCTTSSPSPSRGGYQSTSVQCSSSVTMTARASAAPTHS